MTISSERAPEAFTSHCAMATITTMVMKTTNVNDEVPWVRAWNLHIASRSGDHDSKNWRRRMTTVGRRGLVLEHTTYSIASLDVDNNNGKQTFDDSIGGLAPRPFLYRMDINGDESIWAVSGLILWPTIVVDFLTIVSGVLAPAILKWRRIHFGSLRAHSLTTFVADFSTIVSGVLGPGHSYIEWT